MKNIKIIILIAVILFSFFFILFFEKEYKFRESTFLDKEEIELKERYYKFIKLDSLNMVFQKWDSINSNFTIESYNDKVFKYNLNSNTENVIEVLYPSNLTSIPDTTFMKINTLDKTITFTKDTTVQDIDYVKIDVSILSKFYSELKK